MKNRKIHILGAGIAGLCAAFFAKKKFPQAMVFIHEAKEYAGGRCYSFFDKDLETCIDNATHVIIGANSHAAEFMQNKIYHKKIGFYDEKKQKLSSFWPGFVPHILMSAFNTAPRMLSFFSLLKTAVSLFPFTPDKTKIHYSSGDLSKNLIEPLLGYPDKIFFSSCLKTVKSSSNRITQLIFSDQKIDLAADDLVISALDSRSYHKIFGNADFSYNRIINIFYRTSMALTLPKNLPFMGIINANFDWIFTSPNLLSVTISNVGNKKINADVLARDIWSEICRIRGAQAAFIPSYKVLDYKHATISQNKSNNQKRPASAKTQYQNLFIAGDWTLKNFPCCIEGAILSAKRAVKSLK